MARGEPATLQGQVARETPVGSQPGPPRAIRLPLRGVLGRHADEPGLQGGLPPPAGRQPHGLDTGRSQELPPRARSRAAQVAVHRRVEPSGRRPTQRSLRGRLPVLPARARRADSDGGDRRPAELLPPVRHEQGVRGLHRELSCTSSSSRGSRDAASSLKRAPTGDTCCDPSRDADSSCSAPTSSSFAETREGWWWTRSGSGPDRGRG